jgi:lysophospholipase L1-like esterase
MNAVFRGLRSGSLALLTVVLVAACGGGSGEDSVRQEQASPAAASPVPVADLPGGTPTESKASILDEWTGYADPDAPQSVPTEADPTQALMGKAARLNRQTLEAAQVRKSAASQKAAYTDLVPVYRFYNSGTKAHFYTANEVERAHLETVPGYTNEGIAFEVSPSPQAGLAPVYRFVNSSTGIHLYTISEDERALIQANLPVYQFEGVAYYASQAGGTGLTPLYRFYRQDKNFHFYTAQYQERDNIISNACTYRYEGPAFYVFDANAVPNPPAAKPSSVVLIVGDSLAEGYGVSLGGTVYNFVSKGKVWTERLASEIKTRTARSCNKVVDVSVGGMRTVEGARYIQGWLDQYAPTEVILAQGTNDALQNRGVASMIANLTTMAQASKAIGANVYVMEFAFYPKGTAYKNGMTAMYQGVATDNQTAYINGTGNVPANPTYYHTDSVHLKDSAQPLVLETVWAALQPYL